jgi:transposase-like protein
MSVSNVPNETTETGIPRESAVSNDSNETTETGLRKGASYRAIGRLLGVSASTVWRDANRQQPILGGRRRTATFEARQCRLAGVCIATSVRGWSIRQTAATLSVSRSAVERDLRVLKTLTSRGVDVVPLAYQILSRDAEPSGSDSTRTDDPERE